MKPKGESNAGEWKQNPLHFHGLIAFVIRLREELIRFFLDSFRRGVHASHSTGVYPNRILILDFGFLESLAVSGGGFEKAH